MDVGAARCSRSFLVSGVCVLRKRLHCVRERAHCRRLPSMNHRLTCGLAALCLFALLPRANALTVTQTHSFGIGLAGSNGGRTPIGGYWQYQAFNPGLGTLQSVTVNWNLSINATLVDINYYGVVPVPINYRPEIQIVGHAATSDAPLSSWVNLFASQSGPLVTLQPGEHVMYSALFTANHTQVFSDQASLAGFSGPGQPFVGPPLPHVAVVNAYFEYTSRYGSVGGQGGIDFTLTYTYAVNEQGATALLFAASGLYLAIAQRVHRGRVKRTA